MKIFLIIVLIATIMLIAKAVSDQFIDKFDFYNNLKNFLTQFKINLSFKQDKILNFLESCNSKKQFSIFINCYKDYLKSGVIDLSQISLLEDEEKTELIQIMNNLGSHDADTELKQLDDFIANIDIKLQKTKEDKTKISPMILKLSLLFAIGLSILLI